MSHKTTITLLLFLLVLVVTTGTSKAAYKPAPNYLVVKATAKKIPPRKTLARRAWIVCHVFKGVPCRSALNVAWCESGLDPKASNGQYRGIFQMGKSERLRFGHSHTAWGQARYAYSYYRLSKWGPWECKPIPL